MLYKSNTKKEWSLYQHPDTTAPFGITIDATLVLEKYDKIDGSSDFADFNSEWYVRPELSEGKKAVTRHKLASGDYDELMRKHDAILEKMCKKMLNRLEKKDAPKSKRNKGPYSSIQKEKAGVLFNGKNRIFNLNQGDFFGDQFGNAYFQM